MLYLDTSALLKLYVLEPGSEAVQRRIEAEEQPLPVWEIQRMELINALYLKVFWEEITRDQAEEQLALFRRRQSRGLYHFPHLDRGELSESFRQLAEETPRTGCRTMDVLHVACALQLNVGGFLTFDDRQRELAEWAGLPVEHSD